MVARSCPPAQSTAGVGAWTGSPSGPACRDLPHRGQGSDGLVTQRSGVKWSGHSEVRGQMVWSLSGVPSLGLAGWLVGLVA